MKWSWVLWIVCFWSSLAVAKTPSVPPSSDTSLSSCRRCVFKGDKLVCFCKNKQGKWNQTGLSRTCKKMIRVCDGNLRCGRCQKPKAALTFPSGPYRKSCKDCRLSKTHLICDCRDRKKGWVASAVDKSCKFPISNCNGQLTCGLICPFRNSKPCHVPLIYMPVCGVDGKTYSNRFEAKCINVKVKHEGKCKPQKRPVSRQTVGKKKQKNPFLKLFKKPCVCTFLLAPVCGVNGVSYANACLAKCAGVKLKHRGRCKKK